MTPTYPRKTGRWAVGISLLLHVALILCWREATRYQAISPTSLEVRLQLLQPITKPKVPDSSPPSLPAKPDRLVRPNEVRRAEAIRTTPLPAAVEPTVSLSPSETQAALSLTERALAGVRDAERSLKQEGEQRQHLLPRGEVPNNLRKLPPPIQTALAKSFENHLGELVVLEVREQQEGSNRVTVIHTNKGIYCAYSPILKKSFMRGMPTVQQFGTCSPQ
ncbi:hypothetical protein [Chitinimonas naiadis]